MQSGPTKQNHPQFPEYWVMTPSGPLAWREMCFHSPDFLVQPKAPQVHLFFYTPLFHFAQDNCPVPLVMEDRDCVLIILIQEIFVEVN